MQISDTDGNLIMNMECFQRYKGRKTCWGCFYLLLGFKVQYAWRIIVSRTKQNANLKNLEPIRNSYLHRNHSDLCVPDSLKYWLCLTVQETSSQRTFRHTSSSPDLLWYRAHWKSRDHPGWKPAISSSHFNLLNELQRTRKKKCIIGGCVNRWDILYCSRLHI